MTESATSEAVLGTCESCGNEEIEVYRDNGRCEDCDSEYIFCTVCKAEQHRDGLCRHVFEDSNFEWAGSGFGLPHKWQLPGIKKSLFKLLDLMPQGFATDLRTAIGSGRFHTWLMAPLIGGGGILELHGMPDRDGKIMVTAWGDALIKIGEGDHAAEGADGYSWLVSLYEDKTPEANAATVAWIDEWIDLPDPKDSQ